MSRRVFRIRDNQAGSLKNVNTPFPIGLGGGEIPDDQTDDHHFAPRA